VSKEQDPADAAAPEAAPALAPVPDGTKACDLLGASVLPTQTEVVTTDHPQSAPPSPTGGPVVEGTYRLTSSDAYEHISGLSLGPVAPQTLELRGGLWEIESGGSRGGGRYTVIGDEIHWEDPRCGLIVGGPRDGTSNAGPYTATGSSLTFITHQWTGPHSGFSYVSVLAFTKD
jgi:hypothetical protein